jgi:chemotaxis protein MotB
MGKSKKGAFESPAVNQDAWMVTFSDLICLMLTFFVMLLTMSSIDRKAFKDTFRYLQSSPGTVEYSGDGKSKALSEFIKKYSEKRDKTAISREQFGDLSQSFGNSDEAMEHAKNAVKNISRLIDIKEDERGLVLSFQENLFFDSGRTEIRKENYGLLDSIASAIASCSNDILIMGHTDDRPLKSGEYESNWELSADRGLVALDYFIRNKHLPSSRFYVGGYGSYRPLFPNDSPEHRSLNRRVEIIFRYKQEL